ncbi:MAG TPA: hypothetical protein VMY77_11460 [Chitinophagaceae bacterium]|nr:hypothetical protein [Chitinophagaceae bacterium]
MKIVSLLFLVVILSCNQKKESTTDLDSLAEKYVRLGLDIGQYDADFVDAYYGPDSLKPAGAKLNIFLKDSFLSVVNDLSSNVQKIIDEEKNDTIISRAKWMLGQLKAFGRRIKIFSGEFGNFDEESQDLFGVKAPVYTEEHYKDLVAELDSILPGKGDISARYQQLMNRFIIPKNKLDTVFKTAIAEARRRTIEHYPLPDGENFSLEFVNNKPWTGYNWYKGNYQSLIQINTDLPLYFERAIDLACHEGYPGHHVYNMLLEKKLYYERHWVEISLYPLFSPQSLIAEGSANYGKEVAFPGNERNEYVKNVLLPLAGLDTAGTDLYFKAIDLAGELNFARNEVGRGIINNTMDSVTAKKWLITYGMLSEGSAIKSISFIKKYRSYIINYNYGLQLVRNYIESNGGTASNPAKRWELFGKLLSNPITPADLLANQ